MTTTTDLYRDVRYLRDEQYRDSSRLQRGLDLHTQYRTAPAGEFTWLLPQLEWPDAADVLDVGCGNGRLWERAVEATPSGMHLTLADLSSGMATEAVAAARATGHYASVVGHQCDARLLPFVDSSFDVVTSTFTMFHVLDPEVAAAQIARVLRPSGTAAFLTNGPGHVQEVLALVSEVFGVTLPADSFRHRFEPGPAAQLLVGLFDEVVWRRFDDSLEVTSVDDMMSYLTAGPPLCDASPTVLAQARDRVERELADGGGVFHITKHTGALICRKPRCPRLP